MNVECSENDIEERCRKKNKISNGVAYLSLEEREKQSFYNGFNDALNAINQICDT